MLKAPGKKTGCIVPQLSIAAESNEDISDARMIKTGIEAFMFRVVTVARKDTANGLLDKNATRQVQMDVLGQSCQSSLHRLSSSLCVLDKYAQPRC